MFAPSAQVGDEELQDFQYPQEVILAVVSAVRWLDKKDQSYDVICLYNESLSYVDWQETLEYADVLCILRSLLATEELDELVAESVAEFGEFGIHLCLTAAEGRLIYG